jgi:glycosyltransferase involved in cell wall biosynthesis
MKITINSRVLQNPPTGIEVYTSQLIKGLLNCNIDVKTISIRPLFENAFADINQYESENDYNYINKMLWEFRSVGKRISLDTQIFHSPSFMLPFLNKKRNTKYITTIHDLAFLHHPEHFDSITKIYYKLGLLHSLKYADSIICISESCASDISNAYPELSNKLHVVSNGYENFSKISPDESIANKLNLRKKEYLLTVGTMNERKNFKGALKAFYIAKQAHKDLKLCVVGRDGDKLGKYVTEHREDIIFTGFISQNELSHLYRNAILFLFPSYYEGFGFPVLEATSVGLPVVTSNTSSLPEVSGLPEDYLCNPSDCNSIARLIIKHINDKDWSNKGIALQNANSKKFSWEKMTLETLNVYKKTIDK